MGKPTFSTKMTAIAFSRRARLWPSTEDGYFKWKLKPVLAFSRPLLSQRVLGFGSFKWVENRPESAFSR